MNQEELSKDWYVRYQKVFNKRYSRNQKDRFLKSLITDIKQFRDDLELNTFNLYKNDKHTYRNLYVGDVKKAKTVICTYYDTPAALLGSYDYFDIEKRKKDTTRSLIITSGIVLIFGLIYTIFLALPIFQNYNLLSFKSIMIILGYILYFWLFNRLRIGIGRKNNLVRNTSSLFLLLTIIQQNKSNRVSYAFLDAGCTNDAGLTKLVEQTNATVYVLDSLGADEELYQVSSNSNLFKDTDEIGKIKNSELENSKLLYLISAKTKDNKLCLPSNSLNRNELNEENMNKAMVFLENLIRRK